MVGMPFRGAAFWGSTEMSLVPGAVFWRAVCQVSFPAFRCPPVLKPAASRAVTTAEGPARCRSLLFAAPLQEPEAGTMRRVGLPEEGSALLIGKAALCWGLSSCYSCHHPHICLSSQLGRMAFSSCHRGRLFPLAKANCYCKAPN